ncbi:MAG: protein phosphatase 2C domain-containing protein [Ruminococcus sp.]|jgi:hypothetical protein|nr:protein phosphatase 2C domain-containing protein [Ruminococcus sp.]
MKITDVTQGMWRYMPVPESPEPFPEYIVKAEENAFFRVFGASVRGKKHKYDGTNGDDFFDVDFADRVCIAAAADGAGSRRLSRIGARAASKRAVESLKASFFAIIEENPDFYDVLSGDMASEAFSTLTGKIAASMRSAVNSAYEAVVSAFEERREKPEYENPELTDFASTLLLSAAIPTKGGETLVISLTVGDGVVAVFGDSRENPLTILSVGDKGEFAGETEFLLSVSARSDTSLKTRTRLTRRKADYSVLMTDGVSEDYFPYSPELLRLIADLKLNRILPIETSEKSETDKKIPPPTVIPWVNDPDVKFTIADSKSLIAENEMSAADIYFDESLIFAAAQSQPLEKNAEDALAIWLDNYSERGSFDDRTLIIIIPKNQ